MRRPAKAGQPPRHWQAQRQAPRQQRQRPGALLKRRQAKAASRAAGALPPLSLLCDNRPADKVPLMAVITCRQQRSTPAGFRVPAGKGIAFTSPAQGASALS